MCVCSHFLFFKKLTDMMFYTFQTSFYLNSLNLNNHFSICSWIHYVRQKFKLYKPNQFVFTAALYRLFFSWHVYVSKRYFCTLSTNLRVSWSLIFHIQLYAHWIPVIILSLGSHVYIFSFYSNNCLSSLDYYYHLCRLWQWTS